MENYIATIKQWLGTGSINIFGLPFSGKDTVGVRLAEVLGARLLSSGLILRSAGDKELLKDLAAGVLAPTGKFKDLVLPYLQREDLKNYPLILSSVGRWEGEEYDVIAAANDGGHPIKAVLLLNVSEAEVKNRWEAARMLQDRGQRQDDHDLAILETRIKEFIDKTMPVIETYRKRDLLIPITANKDRDTVFRNALVALYDMAMREQGYDIPLEQ
jgi:adenylate kinase family enzyme